MANKFPFEVPFINRQAEQKYLMEYLQNQPTSMLFVYGPKSTGKTTLINKVIAQLPQDEYAISYLDMRRVLIKDFADFRNLFFPQDRKGKFKDIISGIKVNVGFFGRDVEDENMIKTNIFEVMESKLRKANERGIKPVIIIDEFQYLKHIIIDKEHNLLLVEELWKFFIALTKVLHLAHVICLTSDSYYIEELYAHTKLKNTSEYYLVDHISRQDVQYRLGQKEGVSDEIVSYFREHLGGSVREIRQAFVKYKNTGDYQQPIQQMIQHEWGRIVELYNTTFSKKQQKLFDQVNKHIAQHGSYPIPLGTNLSEMIKQLVDLDIRFFDPPTQTLTANSQSVRKAFQKLYHKA